MTQDDVVDRLFALRDEGYAKMQAKLLPTVPEAAIIGVRTPALRTLAREWAGQEEAEEFLRTLPHRYFDENQLHAFLISLKRDFDETLSQVEAFLPFVDNWATCDQLSPKAFVKRKADLLPALFRWLHSDHPYTVRFAMGMLMQHFLDQDFDAAYPALVAEVQSDHYYVRMMQAWYFATALAKQYGAALPYIEENRLEKWTHNKAVQKALESYRVSAEHKAYLRTLRR